MVIVAAAQIKVVKNTDKNLGIIIKYIKKAAKKKVDIICFPESSLVNTNNKNHIKKINIQNCFKKIKEACRENKINTIIGTNYLKKNKLYNLAIYINAEGKIQYQYDKINLWKSEKNKTKGKKNYTIETKFGKIAIIICWDIAFPEYVKKLSKQGAYIIFCPSYVFNYKRELESYEKIPFVRAFENSSYIIYVDAYTPKTVKYSCICSPSKVLKQIRNREGMIIAKLDMGRIKKLRRYYHLV